MRRTGCLYRMIVANNIVQRENREHDAVPLFYFLLSAALLPLHTSTPTTILLDIIVATKPQDHFFFPPLGDEALQDDLPEASLPWLG